MFDKWYVVQNCFRCTIWLKKFVVSTLIDLIEIQLWFLLENIRVQDYCSCSSQYFMLMTVTNKIVTNVLCAMYCNASEEIDTNVNFCDVLHWY